MTGAPAVRVHQVWADLDKRAAGRRVRVVGLDDTHAVVVRVDRSDLPADIEGMRAFLEPYKTTTVATSGEPGACEGVVLRAADRSVITKARFQDYDRTLKRRQKGAGGRSRPVSA